MSQKMLLMRIAIADDGERTCRRASVIREEKYSVLLDGDWITRADEWKAKRERHKREFLRLQRQIDACLERVRP